MVLEDILREPEFAPYVRRWFFERLTAGRIPPDSILAEARRLDMDLEASGYALALFQLPPEPDEAAQYLSDPAAAVRSELTAYFLKYVEYVLFSLGPTLRAVLIKGGRQLAGHIRRCTDTVEQIYARHGLADWHVAVSSPADSLAALPARWKEVSRLWSWRHILPERHLFLPGTVALPPALGDERCLTALDPAAADPAPVLDFLRSGRREDIPAFTARYLGGLEGTMGFVPMRCWAQLNVRLAAVQAAGALELDRERLERSLPPWDLSDPARYVAGTLSAAMTLRDEAAGGRFSGALGRALDHIRTHYADPALTLGQTARQAGVTASYLSGLFRREMGATFSQYLTARRMERARELLRSTDMPAGAVGRACGYQDGRYFATLFKRTQGCSPTRFRREGK